MRFSGAKNSKKRIPARNWRDPDAPTVIMIITHTFAITNTIITITVTVTVTVTLTPPPTRRRRRGGNRFFEVFGS